MLDSTPLCPGLDDKEEAKGRWEGMDLGLWLDLSSRQEIVPTQTGLRASFPCLPFSTWDLVMGALCHTVFGQGRRETALEEDRGFVRLGLPPSQPKSCNAYITVGSRFIVAHVSMGSVIWTSASWLQEDMGLITLAWGRDCLWGRRVAAPFVCSDSPVFQNHKVRQGHSQTMAPPCPCPPQPLRWRFLHLQPSVKSLTSGQGNTHWPWLYCTTVWQAAGNSLPKAMDKGSSVSPAISLWDSFQNKIFWFINVLAGSSGLCYHLLGKTYGPFLIVLIFFLVIFNKLNLFIDIILIFVCVQNSLHIHVYQHVVTYEHFLIWGSGKSVRGCSKITDAWCVHT